MRCRVYGKLEIIMNKEEIIFKIQHLEQTIPKIKNKQTRLQQIKYMHRLQKQLLMYNFYRKDNKHGFI